MSLTSPHASPEMQHYYATRAPHYDEVYHQPERARDLAFLATHLPGRLRGREVLEVACGTGWWTPYIARVARRHVATDLTAEPLALARLRPGVDQVEFVLADAYALPASLGQFDAAFAGLWFSHVPRRARLTFLHSLHARLRPGARVLWLDNNEQQLKDHPIVETDADGNTYQSRRLPNGSQHRVLKNFPTEGELADLLAPLTESVEFHQLDNFWLCEYRLPAG